MLNKIVKLLALIIGVESLIVMAGWVFGVDWLTRIVPGGMNMKFLTALLFLLSALGLYYMSRGPGEISQIMLPGTALTILLISAVLLAGSLSSQQTGLDTLFVQSQYPASSLGSGTPSVFTVIGFIILGLAGMFFLFPNPRGYDLRKFIGYPVTLVGLVAVLGHMMGQPALYYKFNDSMVPMAINTALAFALLGAGLIINGLTKNLNET